MIKTLYSVLFRKYFVLFRKINKPCVSVSTDWIVLVCSIKYVVTTTKEFTYS